MDRNLTGRKIRTHRRAASLTQGQLASRVGISPSYLNLIEANKRPIAGGLLDRIAVALGISRTELDDTSEWRIVDALNELIADPEIAGSSEHSRTVADFVGRNPEWADLVLKLYRAFIDRNQAVLALADRLSRDPFLGESVHRILTNVTAIRSASEILEKNDDLSDAQRRRFLSIVAADSERLSTAARSLAEFFDNADMRVRSGTAMEHVDTFIFESNNHFAELEQLGEGFLRRNARSGASHHALIEMMVADHEKAAPSPAAGVPGATPETARSRRFRILKAMSATLAGDKVSRLVHASPSLASEAARTLATSALHAYAAAAVLMPYEPFLAAAERWRYDLDALSSQFDVSYEQAAHRLATLRRPGAEGVHFAFMRSDPSGYVTKRLSLPRLPLPRYSNACPLWVIYSAFQNAGATARAFGALPSGDRFLFFARAVEKGPQAVTFPRHLLSIMLACPAPEAGRVVYADGIDQSNPQTTVPVGTTCRLCPRENCGHRQEAALVI
ncbi:helix-turn-helix domain-containing protein [Pseudaminobacter arsenicus]|uniref:Helix-turn-helix domain-containing protein n=1 Tax=Borborobacter arsenicus TaxID=1851146 RepID=A0A432VAB8_9HYPH|nr:helix-turn-helix transcriptional regulator [Pseudaminobacter arsenicus]RUM99128.1 helix-turn-helix domain-containing protein [Pseudaminobacter arsenicus]